MTERLEISEIFATDPEDIYEAWLDGEKHGKMTGSNAKIEPSIDGKFTTWDGYISGSTIAMEPGRRILQKWRTTDFPDESPDSTLEIILERVDEGTKITLIHTEIPEGQAADYEEGWKEFYFEPMHRYFIGKGSL
ncbi:MAG: SRPBCC domain-containing protein [Candidatus Thorarchaeota archaeon]|nr:MAG: SRPBCC domain-containing protein [Candidatus Thorarchaeota archaeon]